MRLRQVNPQNYRSSENINTEFESLVRYLNAAEYGNKTLAELIGVLFNESGEFEGPIEFRFDAAYGLQYRVGEYTNDTQGWKTLATADELRGEAGINVGTVAQPIFSQRYDVSLTSSAPTINYDHNASDNLLVYLDGVLQRPTIDYTSTPTSGATVGTVTLTTGVSGDKATLFRVRSDINTPFTRYDYTTTVFQSNFVAAHSAGDTVSVYLNGILQRPGAGYDYILDPINDLVIFNSSVPAANKVTVFVIQQEADQTLTGLMLEGEYTDPATGKIPYAKVAVLANEIGADRVNGLATLFTSAARIYVGSTYGGTPAAGNLWLNTSTNPAKLKFFDGTVWNDTSPETALPTPQAANAGQFVKVNGTGTALVYGGVDFSGYVPTTSKGASNGVASLDNTGRIPSSQLPSVIGRSTLYLNKSGPVSNANYTISRPFGLKYRITGFAARLTGGTCTAQIAINGVVTGATYSLSVSPSEVILSSPIEVDARTSTSGIGVTITSQASAADLEVSLAIQEVIT